MFSKNCYRSLEGSKYSCNLSEMENININHDIIIVMIIYNLHIILSWLQKIHFPRTVLLIPFQLKNIYDIIDPKVTIGTKCSTYLNIHGGFKKIFYGLYCTEQSEFNGISKYLRRNSMFRYTNYCTNKVIQEIAGYLRQGYTSVQLTRIVTCVTTRVSVLWKLNYKLHNRRDFAQTTPELC